jgi:hypothetical protein
MKRALALAAGTAALALVLSGCGSHATRTVSHDGQVPAPAATVAPGASNPGSGADLSQVDSDLSSLDTSLSGTDAQLTQTDQPADADS